MIERRHEAALEDPRTARFGLDRHHALVDDADDAANVPVGAVGALSHWYESGLLGELIETDGQELAFEDVRAALIIRLAEIICDNRDDPASHLDIRRELIAAQRGISTSYYDRPDILFESYRAVKRRATLD
jgi:hypothetical protein